MKGNEFPWPDAQGIVQGFIQQAELVETGRYMKIVLPESPPRQLTVWIDEKIVDEGAEELSEAAAFMYPGDTEVEGIKNIWAVQLFECLETLPDSATEIVYRRGGFYPQPDE